MNGATERTHRFLNAAIGIYCEKHQEKWEEHLQPAVYAHKTFPISGLTSIFPFFLVFGRDPPSPETLSSQMLVHLLPANHYAHHLVSRLQDAVDQVTQIKSDLKRCQHDHYDSHARHITIPDGIIVYMRKDHVPSHTGLATRFVRNFHGPFIMLGHPYGKSDLLTLRHAATNNNLPHPINVEKVIVVPEPDTDDLQVPNDAIVVTDSILTCQLFTLLDLKVNSSSI